MFIYPLSISINGRDLLPAQAATKSSLPTGLEIACILNAPNADVPNGLYLRPSPDANVRWTFACPIEAISEGIINGSTIEAYVNPTQEISATGRLFRNGVEIDSPIAPTTAIYVNLVGSASGSGVPSVNGITSAVTLAEGDGVTITHSGDTLTISSVGGAPAGTNGQVQINENGAFAGSSAFAWDAVDEELIVGKLTLAKNGTGTIIKATAGTGSTMTVLGDGSTTGDGGQLYIAAGESSTGEGGTVLISGGTSLGGTKGGTVALFSGTTQSGAPAGDVQLGLGDDTALTIHGATGSWRLGNTNSAGTAGQALVSNGSGAAPSWQTVVAGTAVVNVVFKGNFAGGDAQTFDRADGQVQNSNITSAGATSVTVTNLGATGEYQEMMIQAQGWGLATISFTNTINWKLPSGGTTNSFDDYLTALGRDSLMPDGVDFINLWSVGLVVYGKVL